MIIIDSIQPLENISLLKYLANRGITKHLQGLKEVHYHQAYKNYYAIGVKTQVGSWELFNKNFKGTLGSKSFIMRYGETGNIVKVFEGYIDYLSYLELKGIDENCDYMILNSVEMLKKALPKIKDYKERHLYLDNDNAGDEATNKILKLTGKTIDYRSVYDGFKDVNDFLISLTKTKATV